MHHGPETYFAFAILGFGSLVGVLFMPLHWKRKRGFCFLGAWVMLLTIVVGCGGGSASNPPPPPVTPSGTSAVTVTMTSNVGGVTLTHTLQVNVTVTP
jgi:hypothetical protein